MYMDMEEFGSPSPDYVVDSKSVEITLPAHPDYAAQRKFEEGSLAKDRGETERARRLLQEALKLRPNFSEATAALASLEGEVGPIIKARELYRESIKQNPSNVSSLVTWAALEDKQGNYQEARKLYEQATRLVPANTIVLHSWALLERRLGNFSKARELFERTTQLEPRNAVHWQALGQLEARARNHLAAIKYLETALRYASDDYSKAWIHSDLAFSKGNARFSKSEVEEHYKVSLSLNPNSAQTNHMYAEFLKRQGRMYEGEEHESKARILGYRVEPAKRDRRRNNVRH